MVLEKQKAIFSCNSLQCTPFGKREEKRFGNFTYSFQW